MIDKGQKLTPICSVNDVGEVLVDFNCGLAWAEALHKGHWNALDGDHTLGLAGKDVAPFASHTSNVLGDLGGDGFGSLACPILVFGDEDLERASRGALGPVLVPDSPSILVLAALGFKCCHCSACCNLFVPQELGKVFPGDSRPIHQFTINIINASSGQQGIQYLLRLGSGPKLPACCLKLEAAGVGLSMEILVVDVGVGVAMPCASGALGLGLAGGKTLFKVLLLLLHGLELSTDVVCIASQCLKLVVVIIKSLIVLFLHLFELIQLW